MSVYIVKVSDSITIARTATLLIEAGNEDEADNLARERCINNVDIQWTEDETDNTPYDVEEIIEGDEADDLAALARAYETRPAGLDHDEQLELERLMHEHEIDFSELKQFAKVT